VAGAGGMVRPVVTEIRSGSVSTRLTETTAGGFIGARKGERKKTC
jgi:hypothetical protein